MGKVKILVIFSLLFILYFQYKRIGDNYSSFTELLSNNKPNNSILLDNNIGEKPKPLLQERENSLKQNKTNNSLASNSIESVKKNGQKLVDSDRNPSEAVEFKDLIKLNSLYYKKKSDIPYTGFVS